VADDRSPPRELGEPCGEIGAARSLEGAGDVGRPAVDAVDALQLRERGAIAARGTRGELVQPRRADVAGPGERRRAKDGGERGATGRRAPVTRDRAARRARPAGGSFRGWVARRGGAACGGAKPRASRGRAAPEPVAAV